MYSVTLIILSGCWKGANFLFSLMEYLGVETRLIEGMRVLEFSLKIQWRVQVKTLSSLEDLEVIPRILQLQFMDITM